MSPFIYCYTEFHYAEYRYAECRYAEFPYAESRYAEFPYAECRHAECRGAANKTTFQLLAIMICVGAPYDKCNVDFQVRLWQLTHP